MNINEPEIEFYKTGYKSYSFGIKMVVPVLHYPKWLIMTVQALDKEDAESHILAIFRGVWKHSELTFYDDLEEWKKEVEKLS